MLKFKLYMEKDAGTDWLNEMSQKGFAVTGFFAGFYRFEPCRPGEYLYQIDFLDRFASVSEDYRELMKEIGVEIVLNWGFYVILRKKAKDGPFTLYTDADSELTHYRKIRRMLKAATVIEMLCFLLELFCAAQQPSLCLILLTILLGFLVFAIMKALIYTNQKIRSLQEALGKPLSPYQKGQVSPFLSAGLLLNALAMLLRESMAEGNRLLILHFFQGAACALMLFGIFLMRDIFKDV